MELLVKPEILTWYIYTVYMYVYIYIELRLAALKAVSFYLLHNVSTLNQCRIFSCVTVVCKHFALCVNTLLATKITQITNGI
jgi:hypothetical protein